MKPIFKNRNSEEYPHVLCVMITGYATCRINMAKQRVKMFLKQTYPNKSLLIINDGPLLKLNHPDVYELKLPRLHDLGTLRNIALDIGFDSWICQWDDDDVYPIDKIERQVQALKLSNKSICSYRNQIVYSIISNCARYYTSYEWHGIEGTVLHKPTEYRYPESGKGEDTVFIENFKEDLLVINNEPEENIKLHHGSNVWDEFKIMDKLSGQSDVWKINDFHTRLLHETLQSLHIEYSRDIHRDFRIPDIVI